MELDYSGVHILFIAENLALPFSRRTWEEAKALSSKGAKVSVICPKMKGYKESRATLEGIEIYRYNTYEAKSTRGYALEYILAFFWQVVLSFKIYCKRRFKIIHACNPPDLIFPVALLYKPLGVKFIFDHHDVCPELYYSKFKRKDIFYRLLFLFEKLTFKTANYSIATNESYRQIAMERGKMRPENVCIVRSGPELSRLKIKEPNLKFKKGKQFLIAYLGVISEIEGLDLLLLSAQYIVKHRNDVRFAIVGGGTELANIQKQCKEMELELYFDFYGRVNDSLMTEIISTADICVNPDRPSAMTNISTMNKVMEYMALRKPIVQYTMKEGMISAEKASLYATNTDPIDFAKKILLLLNNPALRQEMAEYGYKRIINKLSWKHEKKNLIQLYDKIMIELRIF